MSTTAANTGLVSIDWPASGGPGQFTAHREKRRLDDLAARIGETARTEWWGVDVPFGWPMGWAAFLTDHDEGPAEFPSSTLPGDRPWAPFARRVTDRRVIGRASSDHPGVAGFSVTFDKLGATAAAWAYIEWKLYAREPRMQIDRSGASDEVKVFETYPAAAWRRWNLPKNPASAELEDVRNELEMYVEPAGGDWNINGHERDALVCALIARARSQDRTDLPSTPGDVSAAASEGWIHIQEPRYMRADLIGPT